MSTSDCVELLKAHIIKYISVILSQQKTSETSLIKVWFMTHRIEELGRSLPRKMEDDPVLSSILLVFSVSHESNRPSFEGKR